MVEQPEKVRFDRLVQEQARTHPALAEIYFDAIYARALKGLTPLLQRGQDAGFIKGAPAAAAQAENLLLMWLGVEGVRLRLSLKPGDRRPPHERSATAVAMLPRSD